MKNSHFKFEISETQTLRCHKYSTIIGCCILLMPNGLFWFWGNMSVYSMSYILFVQDSSADVDSPWVYSLYGIFWTLGVLSSGVIAKRVGRKWTIFIGLIIYDAGIFGSYFAVQNSVAALTFTMGVATGAGTGLMGGSALQLSIEWSDGTVGLVTSLIQGSLPMGSLVINQITTLYTNPRNVYPDFYQSPTKYFSQREVLERFPFTFLIVGCFSLSSHLIAFAMVRQRPTLKAADFAITGRDSETTPLTESSQTRKSDTLQRCPSSERIKIAEEKSSIDYTYKQLLKTKSFYTLWLTFFVMAIPNLLSGNYYKMFGQIWIKDDYFITNIATAMAVVSTVFSVFWGLALDTFGVKNCHVTFMASMSLVLFWYYFSAMINRWAFLIMTLVFATLTVPLFGCYTVSVAILYGKTHFTTNFGMLMLAQLCFYISSLKSWGYFLTEFGWFTTFAGTGALVAACIVPTILFIPNF